MLVSATRFQTFAASFTIQTQFLTNSTWFNASGVQVVGDTTTGSPYRIFTNGYNYILSVGSNDVGSSRVLFGATNKTSADAYAKFTHPSLTGFSSISRNHSFEGVIVQFDNFYYLKVTTLQLQWGTDSTSDSYTGNMIYSIDQGLSWTILGPNQTVTPGSSAGSIDFTHTIQSSYLRVGIFLSNNVNNDRIYIKNPELSIGYTLLTDREQAEQFASEIQDYTLCATDINKMKQLTTTKKNEFIDKYERLSVGAKQELHIIFFGDASAFQRYEFLIQ
jgi:hypothetical protein